MLRSVMVISRVCVMGGANLVAWLASSILGLLIMLLVPAGPWASFGAVLIAYHLFLVWFLMVGDEKARLSLDVLTSLLTHLAFVAVAYGAASVANSVGDYGIFSAIPGFRLLGFGITLLAAYEYKWLFGGKAKPIEAEVVSGSAPGAALSGEDYEEFLRYLSARNPLFVKVGTSVTAEYEQWRSARARSRRAVVS